MATAVRHQRAKPQLWAVRKGLVAPEWQWAWRGLVGHWVMWEGGGAPRDVSGNANHSSLPGGTNDPAWVLSERGRTLDFDGSNDYVAIPDDILTGSTNFTISAWVKAGTKDDQQAIVNNRDGGVDGQYQLKLKNSGEASFVVYNSGFQFNLQGTTAIENSGNWHHVVGVRDGGDGRLYVDGQQEDSGSGTVKDLVALDARIGADGRDSGWNFKGNIDDVRIYNRALSAWDVRKLFEAPWAPVQRRGRRSYLVPSVPAAATPSIIPRLGRGYPRGLHRAV